MLSLPIVVMAPHDSEQAVVVNPKFASDVKREMPNKGAPLMVRSNGRNGRTKVVVV